MMELSLRMAKRLNCSAVDPSAVHRCLQSVPDTIVQTEADQVGMEIGLPMTFAFVPVSADRNFFKVANLSLSFCLFVSFGLFLSNQ